MVAKGWLNMLDHSPSVHSLWSPTPVHIYAAADAFAEGNTAGIGGWMAYDMPSSPSQVFWFSHKVCFQDVPAWWDCPANLQSAIAAFEVLAQIGLIALKYRISGRSREHVAVRFLSDSTPAEGVSNKLCSTNSRLAPLSFSMATWSIMANVAVTVEHVPGHRNDWADALSRNAFADMGFDMNRHVALHLPSLWQPEGSVTLLPEDAFWRPYVRSMTSVPTQPCG